MADEELNINTQQRAAAAAPKQRDTLEDQGEGLPRVRTYSADMSRVIKQRGETLASIVNKEKTRSATRGAESAARPWSPQRISIAIATVVLLLAGIGVVIGVFVFSPKDDVVLTENDIIFPNETFTFIADEVPTDALTEQLATIRERQTLSLGEIMRIVVVENGMPLSGSSLIAKLGAPDALVREVTSAMIGIHAFDRNQPFIILEVATYDRTFGAMLGWERSMGRDLNGFFAPVNTESGPPLLTFVDHIIRNLDVRTSQDNWPILYTFPEQNLLIITTNEFTLREIITRLTATRN